MCVGVRWIRIAGTLGRSAIWSFVFLMAAPPHLRRLRTFPTGSRNPWCGAGIGCRPLPYRRISCRGSMPPGYRLEEGGAVEQSAKGQRSVLAVIPVMLVLMLFILMVQLQSVQKLAMVMLTAPLGLIGVTMALLLSHKPFGFVAMLGVFALTGMIIRNSVVLIAQIQANESAGLDRWHAIVDAAAHRLRPILLTAAAAVLGLMPIAGEVFWGPMAYAMMGGLLIATVLTLFFLPSLYAMWYRVRADATQT